MLIYTHPLLYQVVNVKNLLALRRIQCSVRNEFSSGGTGDLSANDTWVELWLNDERDAPLAKKLIDEMQSALEKEWFCGTCGEKNAGSFELCWQCHIERKVDL